MIRRIITVVYLLVGIVVAYQHDYFVDATTVTRIVSAILAVLLWPLLLLGASLHIG
jgi:hypothetical protein